eukprot:15800-Pelagococcus_subviridis.AAC.1
MANTAVPDTPMSDEPLDPENGRVQVRAARVRPSLRRRRRRRRRRPRRNRINHEEIIPFPLTRRRSQFAARRKTRRRSGTSSARSWCWDGARSAAPPRTSACSRKSSSRRKTGCPSPCSTSCSPWVRRVLSHTGPHTTAFAW